MSHIGDFHLFRRVAKDEDVSRELGALVRVRVEARCDCFACGGASGLGCEKDELHRKDA